MSNMSSILCKVDIVSILVILNMYDIKGLLGIFGILGMVLKKKLMEFSIKGPDPPRLNKSC